MTLPRDPLQASAEHARLEEHRRREANWKLWGPYLSERAWGTVREDYSHDEDAWRYFPHQHAPSRAYRWNEDGLAGICDRYGHLCFALALWNTRDPILKERLFGLSGPEGNHGEKAAAHYHLELFPGQSHTIRLRLSRDGNETPFEDFEGTFQARRDEADAFYAAVQNPDLGQDARLIQRQALAGMLWSKQLYYYDVRQWLTGDPILPRSQEFWFTGRNSNWEHLVNFDIIAMPDKWEFPWYATWDSAFHCLPLALASNLCRHFRHKVC